MIAFTAWLLQISLFNTWQGNSLEFCMLTSNHLFEVAPAFLAWNVTRMSLSTQDWLQLYKHGSYFPGLTKQNSLTFPVSFSFFPVFFLMFCFFRWKFDPFEQIIHSSFKYHWKITNNIGLKFPEFSSISCDFPQLFQSVQNSVTGKCLPIFPGFPVRVGTFIKCFSLKMKITSDLIKGNFPTCHFLNNFTVVCTNDEMTNYRMEWTFVHYVYGWSE